MANRVQVLDRITRNLGMLGVAATRGATSVTAGGLTISYVDAVIQAPMGGIDNTASPFLGIGTANPGKLKIKGAATQNAVGGIIYNETNARILAVVCALGNNVLIEAGDTTAQLAEIPGNVDLLGMGQ